MPGAVWIILQHAHGPQAGPSSSPPIPEPVAGWNVAGVLVAAVVVIVGAFLVGFLDRGE